LKLFCTASWCGQPARSPRADYGRNFEAKFAKIEFPKRRAAASAKEIEFFRRCCRRRIFSPCIDIFIESAHVTVLRVSDFAAADRRGAVPLRLRSADGLLVPAGLPCRSGADPGPVPAGHARLHCVRNPVWLPAGCGSTVHGVGVLQHCADTNAHAGLQCACITNFG